MSELESKLAELAKEFELNSCGCIQNPGKFEGETVATPYYYDCYLNGDGTIFEVTEEERVAFEFNSNENWVYLEEDNFGFVYVRTFETEEQAEQYENDVEGMTLDDEDYL